MRPKTGCGGLESGVGGGTHRASTGTGTAALWGVVPPTLRRSDQDRGGKGGVLISVPSTEKRQCITVSSLANPGKETFFFSFLLSFLLPSFFLSFHCFDVSSELSPPQSSQTQMPTQARQGHRVRSHVSESSIPTRAPPVGRRWTQHGQTCLDSKGG